MNSFRYERQKSCWRAFSLIELVMVIVVVGIVAAISIPQFAKASSRRSAEAAAARIILDIELARSLSRAQGVSHRLRFDTTNNSYTVEKKLAASNWASIKDPDHDSQDYVVDLSLPPYNAKISAVDVSNLKLFRFDGYGDLVKTGSVMIEVGDVWKTITVDSATGNPGLRNQQLETDAQAEELDSDLGGLDLALEEAAEQAQAALEEAEKNAAKGAEQSEEKTQKNAGQ